jgi:hypothetical protein
MSEAAQKPVQITITRSPDYRTLYATGVFGGLNPLEGRIIFHLDRLIPKMKEAPLGAMETAEVERELQVEVHLSPGAFIDLYMWMKGHVESMEKTGALVKMPLESPK